MLGLERWPSGNGMLSGLPGPRPKRVYRGHESNAWYESYAGGAISA